MTSFDFLSSFVITRSILDLTLPITQLVQGRERDIADAANLIESLKSLICCKRSTVDTFHKKCQWYCWTCLQSRYWEHVSCKGTVKISHQNQFLLVSKSSDDSFTSSFDSWNRKKIWHWSFSVYSGLVNILSKIVSLIYKNIN